jgi:hypothetical protein
MLIPWLAHAAQFHFYVLRDAPVPLAWSPDPFATSRRTWFLWHHGGFDRFPRQLLGARLRRFTDVYGSPKVHGEAVVGIELVATFLFPPAR